MLWLLHCVWEGNKDAIWTIFARMQMQRHARADVADLNLLRALTSNANHSGLATEVQEHKQKVSVAA